MIAGIIRGRCSIISMRKISLLFLCLLLVACEVTPVVSVEAYEPVVVPSTPSGLTATKGLSSSVTVSWDASDNATGYSLWRASSDSYGLDSASSSSVEVYAGLEERGFQHIATVASGTVSYEDTVSSSGVYVYAIVSFRDFSVSPADGRSSGIVYSSPGDFVEGCVLMSDDTDLLTVSGVATSSSFTLSWDMGVMYSVLGYDALYDYSYAVGYRLSGDEDWISVELDDAQAGSVEMQLEAASSYEFIVSIDILDDSGAVVNTVTSSVYTFLTGSSEE